MNQTFAYPPSPAAMQQAYNAAVSAYATAAMTQAYNAPPGMGNTPRTGQYPMTVYEQNQARLAKQGSKGAGKGALGKRAEPNQYEREYNFFTLKKHP